MSRDLGREARRHALVPFREAWSDVASAYDARYELTMHTIAIAEVLDAGGEAVPPAWQVRLSPWGGWGTCWIEDWHAYGTPCPRRTAEENERWPDDCSCEEPMRSYVPMVEAPELLVYAGNVIARLYPLAQRKHDPEDWEL